MKGQDQNVTTTTTNQSINILMNSKEENQSKQTEKEKILLLEEQIQKKLDESKGNRYEVDRRVIQEESFETNNGVPEAYDNNNASTTSLLGLDEDVLQEEMEWVREMKFQSKVSPERNGTDENCFQFKVEKTEEKFEPKEEETRKIDDLAKQVAEMIAKEKNKERERIKQQKEEEERELMSRLEEEIKLAEEMRILQEEGETMIF